MTFQAAALGLSVRQFRAFDRAALAAEFRVPEHWEVSTMAAFGRVPPATAQLSPDRAGPPPRERRTVDDIRWPTG
jgi:hypothetical protein